MTTQWLMRRPVPLSRSISSRVPMSSELSNKFTLVIPSVIGEELKTATVVSLSAYTQRRYSAKEYRARAWVCASYPDL